MAELTESQALAWDPDAGSKGDGPRLRLHSVRIVTTRKQQECWLGKHYIASGERVRFEKAIVDGEWSNCHCCLDCIESELEAPDEA